jgi:hypothetical protein
VTLQNNRGETFFVAVDAAKVRKAPKTLLEFSMDRVSGKDKSDKLLKRRGLNPRSATPEKVQRSRAAPRLALLGEYALDAAFRARGINRELNREFSRP